MIGMRSGETMQFLKMHGCGNDFVVTHLTEGAGRADALMRAAPAVCDRRRGVGADGLIVLLPSERADLRMRIANADGSEAEMCGNGIRCAFVYARMRGLLKAGRAVFETLAGPIETEAEGDGVRVNMGRPRLAAAQIPVTATGSRVVDREVEAGGRRFRLTAVSMGNPHAVIHADELTDELVLGFGPQIERHPFFPRHVNVEFVKVLSPDRIRMRVFERGVGETQACGTGACAAAVAGVLTGRSGTSVTVELSGGELAIAWDGDPGHAVMMSGPAVCVYEGCMALPGLDTVAPATRKATAGRRARTRRELTHEVTV